MMKTIHSTMKKVTLSFSLLLLHMNLLFAFRINTEEIETEYVTVRFLSRRSLDEPRRLHVRAFGDDHHVTLEPAPVLTPGFRVVTIDGSNEQGPNISSSKVPEEVLKDGQFYTTAGGRGSFYVKDGDTTSIEGILGDRLLIVPLAQKKFSTKETNHIVYRLKPFKTKGTDDTRYPDDPKWVVPGRDGIPFISFRQSPPSSVTVEILSVFDYVNSQAMGMDSAKLTTYAGIFWNSANNVYADTKDPTVSLALAGIVITKSSNDEPYISNNKVDDVKVEDSVLSDFKDWIAEQSSSFPAFDTAILHMSENAGQNYAGTWVDTITGLAYVGAACNPNGYNTGFIEDRVPSFTGVLTGAHEVAHTLNVPHDGDDDASNCPYDDGFRMGSPNGNSINTWKFSECSLSIMRDYVRSVQGNCMWTTPTQNKTTTLPFFYANSLDDQCKARFDSSYTFSGTISSDICEQLWCTNTQGRRSSSKGGAIEGTPCDVGKICLKGVCSASSTPSLDDQCVALFGAGYTADQKTSPEVCKQLNCINGATSQTKGGAADGSACGYYGICKQNECILQVLSADDQCKRNFGSTYHVYQSNFVTYNNCETLWCTVDDQSLTSRGPADPNTSCDTGKVCRDGSCVAV